MSEGLNFDSLDLIQVPVSIGGEKYTLCEADEAAGAAYRNARVRGAKLEEGGDVTSLPSDIGGLQALLVCRCLYYCKEDGNLGALVPQSTVRKWPSRIVRPLFDKVMEISELEEEEDTTESLEKQIARLEKRLMRLRENRAKKERKPTEDNFD